MSDFIIELNCKRGPVSLETNSLEYAPNGVHTITATANGEPAVLTVDINEGIVEGLNGQLEQWIEAAERGEASRPFVDFDHSGNAAAAIPKKFYWENGLRLSVEWTQAGKEAIEGRNYSYFSPELMIDRETGTITGLPPHGSIGSLVNAPAFQQIERLAAASHNQKQKNKMDEVKELQEKLTAAEAKLSDSEKENEKLQASVESVSAERDESVQKIEALNERVENLRKEKIEASIAAKNINEDSRPALLEACLKADDDGAAILGAFSAPKIDGIDPIKKEEKKAVKTEEKVGLSRLTASIAESLKTVNA
jgi:phage I-like protein